MPHAAAGSSSAFRTITAVTNHTRCSGATSWRRLNDIPNEATVAPMDTAMPALNRTAKRC
jgi:hypothetical protein